MKILNEVKVNLTKDMLESLFSTEEARLYIIEYKITTKDSFILRKHTAGDINHSFGKDYVRISSNVEDVRFRPKGSILLDIDKSVATLKWIDNGSDIELKLTAVEKNNLKSVLIVDLI